LRQLSLRRLPIRIKLTLLSAAVLALVLTAAGVFLYFTLKADLDRTIRQALDSRAGELATLARGDPQTLAAGRLRFPAGEEFAQIVNSDGRVVAGTPNATGKPLLTLRELRRTRTKTIVADRDERVRLLAHPLRTGGRSYVIVVGAQLEDREQALETLAGALLIGGPLLLLLASAIAYGVASAALRPVEAMRRRAATVSAAERGARLPLAQADDEVRRLGETLNEMLDRLERALARERQFVADASHELRTPVAILKAELDLALEGGRSPAELEAALQSAAEEADHLAELAEELLVVAQADQGQLPVRRRDSEVAELLRHAAARFETRARAEARPLLVDAPHDLRVAADPLRVQQALGNLIDNALRYGDGTIRISAAEQDGQIELHVIDSGRGFPPALLEGGTAFERFRRGEARSGPGAGLGLSIVSAIAQAHGGRAGIANLSFGADAWITLPVART